MKKIALLSNVTVGLLAEMLGKTYDVYLSAGFDTWQQEMLAPSSNLYGYRPEAVVVLLHANAYGDIWDSMEEGCRAIDGWCGAWKTFVSKLPGVPVFVSSIDVSNVRCRYGAKERLDAYFENYLIERVRELYCEGNRIYILPVKDIVTDLGRDNFYRDKTWYMGAMPYSMKGLSALGKLIGRYVSAAKGAEKKCIAVDLDNTLWGGVIGEDGVNGIVLSNHKEGARYKDAQRMLKKMKEQGVMLAILSKNNREDVEPVFAHPDMVLKREDFVAEAINWEPKSENLRQIAESLNIGTDAFVFLDDNPAEREQMRALCPETAVADFPKDTSQLPRVIAEIYDEYFFALDVTAEDAGKTDMYRTEAKRKSELAGSASVEDFLKKLEMTMDIHFMESGEEKRVTQLTNKTNQFNVTTKRYGEEEINHLADDSDSDVVTVHLGDKYGGQGLAAVVILKYAGETADIDTFLMSCRVMGRCAEKEILAGIKEILKQKGIRLVRASYIRTAKNTPVENLYEQMGFGIMAASEDKKEYQASILDLPEATGYFRRAKAGGIV